LFVISGVFAQSHNFSKVPGVVVNYEPAQNKRFLGSPSICVLPNGTYIVSHDYFGPESNCKTHAQTFVFESKNKGQSWEKIATINQFWGGLFFHNNALYIMGCDNEKGNLIIRKSSDGGHSWTDPTDQENGLIRAADVEKGYHTSAVPVVVASGRVWRAMEATGKISPWGGFEAFVLSAPADADLLNAASWKTTNRIAVDPSWNSDFKTWLEGNVVLAPGNKIVNMMRADTRIAEKAAILSVNETGTTLTFNPATDLIDFPGGCKKFVVRFDEESGKYWTLSDEADPKYTDTKIERRRNKLVLMSSTDLRSWEIRSVILFDEDVEKSGFQYVDWLFDGKDIIMACRTAFFDGVAKADNQHNSNFITFHRIEDFRKRNMSDAPLMK
jgi:hypothetical protein